MLYSDTQKNSKLNNGAYKTLKSSLCKYHSKLHLQNINFASHQVPYKSYVNLIQAFKPKWCRNRTKTFRCRNL